MFFCMRGVVCMCVPHACRSAWRGCIRRHSACFCMGGTRLYVRAVCVYQYGRGQVSRGVCAWVQ